VRVKRPRVPSREIHAIANGLFGPITEMQGSTAGELEAASLNHGFRRNSPNRASTRITAMAV
jgi:hypothetical protein